MINQLEEDDGSDRDFRSTIQSRFAELGERLKHVQDELALTEVRAAGDRADTDPTVLDLLPQLPIQILELPEELLRKLFSAFRLSVRYNPHHRTAVIKVTVRADTLQTLEASVPANLGDQGSTMEGTEMRQFSVAPYEVPPTGFEPALPP